MLGLHSPWVYLNILPPYRKGIYVCACMGLASRQVGACHKRHSSLHSCADACRLSDPDASAAAHGSDSEQASQLFIDMRASLNSLVGQPSKAEITAALRSQLEQGDVVSACQCYFCLRSLQGVCFVGVRSCKCLHRVHMRKQSQVTVPTHISVLPIQWRPKP